MGAFQRATWKDDFTALGVLSIPIGTLISVSLVN